MAAAASLSSDAMVGRLTLAKASDSIAITRVHFSSMRGLPLFFYSSGNAGIAYLIGGSLTS